MAMSPRLLRPRASGFNPKSISGLLLWLDAADSSSYTVATGVSEWRDKSGNARNFVQATGNNQPAISTTTQNGKALFEFDGTNDRLVASGNFLQIANCTLFAAFRRLSGTYGGVLSSSTDSDKSPGILIDNTVGGLRGFTNVSVAGVSVVDTFCVLSGVVNAGATTVWVNGTQRDSDAAVSTLDTTGTTTSIGSYRQSAANYFNGYIGELIAYNAVLSASQRQSVQSYLGKKWGITVA